MADEKIRISWDEVNSPEVDQKVKQQEMLGRMQDHYQQQAPPPLPGQTETQHRPSSILYNTIVCMALFGFGGGVLGWAVGEIPWKVIQVERDDYIRAIIERYEIFASETRGELTEAEARNRLEHVNRAYQDNEYLAVDMDETLSDTAKQRRIEELAKRDGFKSFLRTFLWTSCFGILLAFSLSVAEPSVSRNWRGVVINGSVGLVLGLLGGAVVGSFIDSVYSAMLGGHEGSLGRRIIARSLAWGILGLFLSIAPGIVLKNWKRFGIGLAGGLLGGIIGGILFDPIFMVTERDVVSRFVAIVAIGTAAGAGTGLIESVAKSGWLRVVGGLITGKQFIIYKNPTYLGSSPQCEIYLFKDPQVGPQHAAIHTVPGGYELEDLRSATGTFVNGSPVSRVRLRGNDHIQIGATALLFQEKERAGG